VGQSANQPCGSNIVTAKKAFEKKFNAKTGNTWDNRKSFKPKPKLYTLVEIDYGDEGDEDDIDEGRWNSFFFFLFLLSSVVLLMPPILFLRRETQGKDETTCRIGETESKDSFKVGQTPSSSHSNDL
jgi:hypothetical protein